MKRLAALLLIAITACAGGPSDPTCADGKCDELGEFPEGAQYDRFRGFTENVAGIPGILPPNAKLHPIYRNMDDELRHGLAAWTLFAADGRFLREISLASDGYVSALRTLDSRTRNQRWEEFGVLNDPGCRPATEADRFGLFLDDCDDPYSSGVLGMRLMPNPAFDQDAWDAIGGAEGHFSQDTFKVDGEKLLGWEVEPPYLPSLACTMCHVGPSPVNPPKDIHNPQWDEVDFTIGNQFFREGALLGSFLPEDEFFRQVLYSQPPGTSDTSRVATDHIFNPGVMNSIAGLALRPKFVEKVDQRDNPDAFPCEDGDGFCVDTFHVLKDGGDSSGVTGAALRVFLNVGACTDQMLEATGHSYLKGEAPQSPVSRRQLREECSEYQALMGHVGPALSFLISSERHDIHDAEGFDSCVSPVTGQPCLTEDDAVIHRGKEVFAETCATCHSSIQPEPGLSGEQRLAFFRDKVDDPAFWTENFFSDDHRYPVTVLGTNASRAMATNALEGHVWEEYSSRDYKQSPAVPAIQLSIPFLPGSVTLVDAPEGGRGYYRTASLLNVWSSAPFFHNNGLGIYNGRFDLEGRIEAFEDASRRLLGLDPRLGDDTIRRTTGFSWLDAGLLVDVPVPAGTPIDILANLGAAIGRGEVSAGDFLGSIADIYDNLKEYLNATDLVQDKGHTFGTSLSPDDKLAVIELLKTL